MKARLLIILAVHLVAILVLLPSLVPSLDLDWWPESRVTLRSEAMTIYTDDVEGTWQTRAGLSNAVASKSLKVCNHFFSSFG